MTLEELKALVDELGPAGWEAARFKGEEALLECGPRGMPDDLVFTGGACVDEDPEMPVQLKKVRLLASLANLAPEILALVEEVESYVHAQEFEDEYLHSGVADALDAFNAKLEAL